MLCKQFHRLHSEYEQSFYGIALHTVQIPGLTPALKQCSRDGRLFAILTLSDEDGVKWQITPTHWERQVQKQSRQHTGAVWKIAPLERSEYEIPSSLRLFRRKTDGCKGLYDPGESARGTIESVRDLLAWIEDQEQEEWEARVVNYSTNALQRRETSSFSSQKENAF